MDVELCESMPCGKYVEKLKNRRVVWFREEAFDTGDDALESCNQHGYP
jgi:hypothetical protein